MPKAKKEETKTERKIEETLCPDCNGGGIAENKECERCGGKGTLEE